jgi:hypothetical protein
MSTARRHPELWAMVAVVCLSIPTLHADPLPPPLRVVPNGLPLLSWTKPVSGFAPVVLALKAAGSAMVPSRDRPHPEPATGLAKSRYSDGLNLLARLSSHLLPIWLVIVGSVIFLSSASRNALLRMIESVWSPSNGRKTLSADLFVEPRPGTMHRY